MLFWSRLGWSGIAAGCAIGISSALAIATGKLQAIHFLGITLFTLLVVGATLVLWNKKNREGEIQVERQSTEILRIVPWLIVAIHVLTLALFLLARTSQAIVSPWTVLGWTIFVWYGLGIFLSYYFLDQLSSRWSSIVLVSQALVSLTVSLFVYRFGFGYDPFVHQAAEHYLLAHGTLSPPSILYAGLYGLIVSLARLTQIDPAFLDRALVPLLSAVFLSVVGKGSLSFWRERPLVRRSLLALWIIPFLSLTFTVPHNLTYLILFCLILLLPRMQQRFFTWIGALLAVFALTIHPLLGIPCISLIVSTWIARKFPRLAGLAAFLMPIIGLAGAFFLYIHRVHGVLLPFTKARFIETLYRLSSIPAIDPAVAWGWKAFYLFFSFWPLLFIVFGYIGLRMLPKDRAWIRQILVGTALSTASIAIGLAACVRLPNILPNEQFEFALRLRYALPLFFVPGVMLCIDHCTQTRRRFLLGGVKITLLATMVWYLSYPQLNPVMHRSAPGVGKEEWQAVQLIEQLATSKDYLALTPQMVSAAALAQIGFERELQTTIGPRYPYAVPTGGELYAFYLRLWRERDTKELLKSAQQLTKTTELFVVMPHAWDPNGVLDRRLRGLASKTIPVGITMTLYRIEAL